MEMVNLYKQPTVFCAFVYAVWVVFCHFSLCPSSSLPTTPRPSLYFFFFHHQLKYKRSLVNDKKYQNDEPKIIYKFTAILPYYNGPIFDQKIDIDIVYFRSRITPKPTFFPKLPKLTAKHTLVANFMSFKHVLCFCTFGLIQLVSFILQWSLNNFF